MIEDPLQIQDLPSDPKEMALRLLGMTVAELKGIDEKVVSGKNYVGGLKTDVNKLVQDFNANLSQPIHAATQHVAHPQTIPHEQIISPLIVQPVQSVASTTPNISEQVNDADQMEFNFYRKVKPEDLEYQLKVIDSRLTNIESKLEYISNVLKKNYQSLNGNHSQ